MEERPTRGVMVSYMGRMPSNLNLTAGGMARQISIPGRAQLNISCGASGRMVVHVLCALQVLWLVVLRLLSPHSTDYGPHPGSCGP